MANYGFKSVPANYINQYSALQQDHLEKLREEIIGNREDVSTKNRKLSAETNKRRRELANKKKSRETEEERRRLEILAERKARIQDVTYRYQRGTSGKSNNTNPSPRSRATRNRRAFSAPVTRHNQINLDDALRTIRGNTQQPYNIGDSGAAFLQKYGAHLRSASSKESDEATSKHSQSVRELTNHNSSLFEQQLVQHQATLKKNNVDTTYGFNDNLMQELKMATSDKDANKDGDSHSVESLDSLESEQPSFRSHVISSGFQLPSKSNINNNLPTSENASGDGTYRQESPSVVINDQNCKSISPQTQVNSKQSTKTTPTAVTDTNAFLGFQVVNNNDKRVSRRALSADQQDRSRHVQQTAVEVDVQPRPPTNVALSSKDADRTENDSFYLKSRTESQTIVSDFPAHAWSSSNTSQAVYTQPEALPASVTHSESNTMNVIDNRLLVNNDIIGESASDCEGPRSILKRRNSRSSTLPRSHSSPNIRDSLEVTKQHMHSSKVETPQSAKKSVRFSSSQSEPVFFQKGSSPSSIPRPVQNKPKSNVPRISGAITPNVSDKPITGKTPSASPKGPMVANHNIPVSNPADKNNKGADTGTGKPNILDIQLDRTPTDDEIDVLWDKVRDCLLESPRSSRSAPADIQHPPETPDVTIPPKQPIKKITASNINQIGRAQSAGPRRRTASETSQSPLQRPKQNQKSFVHNNDTTRSQYTGGIITQQHGSNLTNNGQATISGVQSGPTHSTLEPNVSAMVNNTPQDVSESMMAYLTAEQLAGHESLTDQDIMKVMSDSDYRQQLAANGRPVAPMSALSMEEHRILQSLDRLNEKLKVVEEGSHSYRSNQSDYQQPMPSPASASSTLYNGHPSTNHSGFSNSLTSEKVQLKPHPPYTGSTSQRSFSATPRGFRGHKPLLPRQRATSADIVRQHNMASTQVTGANRQFRLY